jgi:membrane-bound lytic murein transglycosylase F
VRSAILLSIISILVSSCGPEQDGIAVPKSYSFDLDSIKSRNKLVALVDNSTTSYFIYKGRPMGFEYELLERFTKHIGVELEVKVVYNLDSMMHYLNQGIGDVLAANITSTANRKKRVAFTNSIHKTHQVLVQRNIRDSLLTELEQLSNNTVHVWSESSFLERLQNISGELDEAINIVAVHNNDTSVAMNMTLQLIEAVSKGEIDYTVADENVAKVQKKMHGNLNIDLDISLEQNIAWAFRHSDTALLSAANEWLEKEKNHTDFYTIYTKYFKARTNLKRKLQSDYSSVSGGQISPYDEIIKQEALEINWDWRLLTAQIFQESKFDPAAESWAGAYGLMQLVPHTAAAYGLDSSNIEIPHANIRAGVKYLIWINEFWAKSIDNETERQKFVLASYNVGLGHIIDAKNLADKFGADPTIWDDNVEDYILKKSESKFYTDDVCKHGYCRGKEPYNYVKNIMAGYEHYKNLIPLE